MTIDLLDREKLNENLPSVAPLSVAEAEFLRPVIIHGRTLGDCRVLVKTPESNRMLEALVRAFRLAPDAVAVQVEYEDRGPVISLWERVPKVTT